MLGAMAMAVVLVVLITGWTAHRDNLSAEADSQTMVEGGLAARAEELSSIAYDWFAWTLALDEAVERDVGWLTENMGSAVDGMEMDILQVTWPDDWSSVAWTTERNLREEGPSTVPVIPTDLVREVHAKLQSFELGEQDTQSFAIELGSRSTWSPPAGYSPGRPSAPSNPGRCRSASWRSGSTRTRCPPSASRS